MHFLNTQDSCFMSARAAYIPIWLNDCILKRKLIKMEIKYYCCSSFVGYMQS